MTVAPRGYVAPRSPRHSTPQKHGAADMTLDQCEAEKTDEQKLMANWPDCESRPCSFARDVST